MRTWIGRCSAVAASGIVLAAGRTDCGSVNTGTARVAANAAGSSRAGAGAAALAGLGTCGAGFAGGLPGSRPAFASLRDPGAAGISTGAISGSGKRATGATGAAGGGGARSTRDKAAAVLAGACGAESASCGWEAGGPGEGSLGNATETADARGVSATTAGRVTAAASTGAGPSVRGERRGAASPGGSGRSAIPGSGSMTISAGPASRAAAQGALAGRGPALVRRPAPRCASRLTKSGIEAPPAEPVVQGVKVEQPPTLAHPKDRVLAPVVMEGEPMDLPIEFASAIGQLGE